MKTPILFMVAVAVIGLASASHAAPIVFNDKALFLTLTGATAATTIPTTSTTSNTGFASGSLAFTLGPGAGNFSITNWSPRLPGNELAISGPENFNIDITSGTVFSFGFDFI